MNDENLKLFRKQHVDNYKSVILESIKNNTKVLIDDDIYSLLSKPPLDSMDLLKSKFLSTAKKYKIVLNTEELDKLLNKYRDNLLKCCSELKKIRIDKLSLKVNSFNSDENYDVIKLLKKDFIQVNKDMKSILKNQLNDSFENIILKNFNIVFSKNLDSDIIDKVSDEIVKYMKSSYRKQLLENVDIKIMVKDTTLMNFTKEQAERYLFTLNNSRLLNDSLQ